MARVGLQGDAMTVDICRENPHIDEDIALFYQALAQDDEMLGERFRVLARAMGRHGSLIKLYIVGHGQPFVQKPVDVA